MGRVFWFDESSVNCAMTRLYGRAFLHERVCGYVADVRFERMSVMGALGLGGVVAPFTFRGALNGGVFGGVCWGGFGSCAKGGGCVYAG